MGSRRGLSLADESEVVMMPWLGDGENCTAAGTVFERKFRDEVRGMGLLRV